MHHELLNHGELVKLVICVFVSVKTEGHDELHTIAKICIFAIAGELALYLFDYPRIEDRVKQSREINCVLIRWVARHHVAE